MSTAEVWTPHDAGHLLRLPSDEEVLAPFASLSDEEKKGWLVKRVRALKAQAPSSLRAHTQLVHRTDMGDPQVAQAHHSEWVDVLEDREQFPYVVISAPPGYAKSSWSTVAYSTWRIGSTGGAIRLGVIANTHAVARGFSMAVRDAVESPAFQETYPGVTPDYDRAWRDTEWAVKGTPPGPNMTFLASGMNGPVQSKRFDEIVLDDPTTWQQARSDQELDKQRRWIKNTLIKRFPPGKRPPNGNGGRMVVVLTRWSPNDLVPTFVDMGFRHLNMPALGYWDRVATCPTCAAYRDPAWKTLVLPCEHCGSEDAPEVEYGSMPLWEELEDAAMLAAQRDEDELIFELVMQGNPKVLSGSMFDPAWLNHGKPPKLEEYDKVVVAVDTASGKSVDRGDFFALARLCTYGPQVWVDMIDRGRYNALQREDHVLAALGLEAAGREGWSVMDEALWRRKPDALVIEDKGEGTDLIQRLRARHIPVRIVDAQANDSKTYRAAPLAGAYRNGQVWHPAFPSTNPDALPTDMVVPRWVRSYEAELEAFPEGPHDDQVDAVAHAYNRLGLREPRVVAVGG